MYNLYNFEAEFKQFLQREKVSSTTVRNYLSDFRHFWSWFLLYLRQKFPTISEHDTMILTHITPVVLKRYKEFLVFNTVSIATSNRRLATIRKFVNFAKMRGWISKNTSQFLTNIPLKKTTSHASLLKSDVLNQFSKYLAEEKVSKLTKRNYLTDIRHFLSWAEEKTVGI